MTFFPTGSSIEVEPMNAEGSVILNDAPKFVECAKVIKAPWIIRVFRRVSVGDIIFFRPHGFFELPVFKGKKRYVVKFNDEIVLGVLKNVGE